MKKFINKLRNKYVIAAIGFLTAISALGGTSVLVFSAGCSGTVPTSPVFNYWPLTYNSSDDCHDLPLIDVRNLSAASGSRDNRYSASQTEHDAGINANVGDQVRVSVYFHNGATNEASYVTQTTADNVEIGSTYSTSAATVHEVAGSISASNAATVTSTSAHQGGNITITTPSTTTLKYVPGSTQMCIQYQAALERGADMSQTCGTDSQGQPKILINLPDGIANGTVGIGNLKSCFLYSGEVVYTLQVVGSTPPPSNGTMTITKQVEDLTSGNTGTYSSSVNAKQGDSVEYKISVKNTSNITLNNVVVSDPVISGIQYNNSSNTQFNIGTMSAGQTVNEYVDAKVTASSGTLVNTATATASNASTVHASATVCVSTPQQQNGSMTITKQVEDLTSGNNNNYSSSVTANQGDAIEYKIAVTNTSSITLNNVVVNDPAISGIQFTQNSNSGSAQFNIGTMSAGQTVNEYVDATVTASSGTLINTATATASNASSVNASATVNVNGNICTSCCSGNCNTTGQLSITKLVRDVTSNGPLQSSITANSNDQVQYQITVSNFSSTTLNNVVMNDTMPSGISYTSSTVSGSNYGSNYYGGTINLGSMYPGQQSIVMIYGTVNGNNGQSIQNTAYASANNASTVYASATVYVQGQILPATTSMTLSKSAFNNTKNVNATSVPADRDDYITYTLTAQNTGNVPVNGYQITDDLSGVLNYASIVNPNGGFVNGNIISWPSVTISPNSTVQETFQVRVNYNLPSSYNNLQLVNTYGNTVTIQLNNPKVLGATITAPATGPVSDIAYGLGFAGLLTLAFYFLKKKMPKIKIKLN